MKKSIISKLSQITGAPTVDFKVALGIPLEPCTATTKKKALAAWQDTAEGSEKEVAAMMRVLEFPMTLIEVSSLYIKATEGSALERVILAKWNTLSLEKVATATTMDEAVSAYVGTPINGDARPEALRKMYELFEG